MHSAENFLQSVEYDNVAAILRVRGKNTTENEYVKVCLELPLFVCLFRPEDVCILQHGRVYGSCVGNKPHVALRLDCWLWLRSCGHITPLSWSKTDL